MMSAPRERTAVRPDPLPQCFVLNPELRLLFELVINSLDKEEPRNKGSSKTNNMRSDFWVLILNIVKTTKNPYEKASLFVFGERKGAEYKY